MSKFCSVKVANAHKHYVALDKQAKAAEKKAEAAASKAAKLKKLAQLKKDNLQKLGTKFAYGPPETLNMTHIEFSTWWRTHKEPGIAEKKLKLIRSFRTVPPELAKLKIQYLEGLDGKVISSPKVVKLVAKAKEVAKELPPPVVKKEIIKATSKTKFPGGPPETRNMNMIEFSDWWRKNVEPGISEKKLKLIRTLRKMPEIDAIGAIEYLQAVSASKLKQKAFKKTLKKGFAPKPVSKPVDSPQGINKLVGIDELPIKKTTLVESEKRTFGEFTIGVFEKDEFEAMSKYKGSGYREILAHQRARNGGPQVQMSAQQKDSAMRAENALRSALKKSELNKDMTVYRGMRGQGITYAFERLDVGDTMPVVSFNSASTSKAIASGFGGDVLLEIKLPAGTNAIHIDKALRGSGFSHPNSGEQEVLMPDIGSYYIESITKERGRVKAVVKYLGGRYKSVLFGINEDYVEPDIITVDHDSYARSVVTEQELYLMLVKGGFAEIAQGMLDAAA